MCLLNIKQFGCQDSNVNIRTNSKTTKSRKQWNYLLTTNWRDCKSDDLIAEEETHKEKQYLFHDSQKKNNYDIWTNYIKAKIDKTKQKRKCRLYRNWNGTVNHINDCSNPAQKSGKTGCEISVLTKRHLDHSERNLLKISNWIFRKNRRFINRNWRKDCLK